MSTIDRNEGQSWTVLSTLQWTTAYFERHRIENPRADAEILLAYSLDCNRIDLYLRHDQPLHADELARFRDLIRRRSAREPVAYIVGHKEFWSLDFQVNPAVLIPRPESECLVEAAVGLLPASRESGMADILELGTGSGAIITALAHERPGNRYWATDRAIEAVTMAAGNSRRHVGAAVTFLVGRWFESINRKKARFDMILSNPPYVAQGDIAGLAPEIRANEPRMALNGGPDGLCHIHELIVNAPDYLKPGGVLILEIGYDQGAAVAEAGRSQRIYSRVTVEKDYSGQDRVALFYKTA